MTTATTNQTITPAQLAAYIQQYGTAMTPGGVAGVSQYQNSPNYDVMFGHGMANTWANSPLPQALQAPQLSTQQFLNSAAYQTQYGNSPSSQSLDPSVRFANDPGVQMAIQAGMPTVANSYANKGLGASGPAANGIAQYMYNNYLNFTGNQGNLYNQEYQNALTNQQQAVATYLQQQGLVGQNFNNYQGQLSNLANMGVSTSGQQAANQYNSGQNLSSLLAQANLSTGQNLAQTGLNVNELTAQLLANQGVLNANAYIGTGAGMSNNILSGNELLAQLQNAQNASNAGSMNSLLQGQGAMQGAYKLQGGGY